MGRFSPRHEIRESALWNLNRVMEVYDPLFLDKLEYYAALTCKDTPQGNRQNSKPDVCEILRLAQTLGSYGTAS